MNIKLNGAGLVFLGNSDLEKATVTIEWLKNNHGVEINK